MHLIFALQMFLMTLSRDNNMIPKGQQIDFFSLKSMQQAHNSANFKTVQIFLKLGMFL